MNAAAAGAAAAACLGVNYANTPIHQAAVGGERRGGGGGQHKQLMAKQIGQPAASQQVIHVGQMREEEEEDSGAGGEPLQCRVFLDTRTYPTGQLHLSKVARMRLISAAVANGFCASMYSEVKKN